MEFLKSHHIGNSLSLPIHIPKDFSKNMSKTAHNPLQSGGNHLNHCQSVSQKSTHCSSVSSFACMVPTNSLSSRHCSKDEGIQGKRFVKWTKILSTKKDLELVNESLRIQILC